MKYIELTQGQWAKIDDEDWEELSKYKWCAHWHSHTRSYRAVRTVRFDGKQKTILMHRQIMAAQPGQQVDHSNHETLDNQRRNLRTCNNSQNQQNLRPRAGGSSTYKGVSWYKQYSKWQAQIMFNGHAQHLGYFGDERKAAEQYDAKARELFGKFAQTNF